MLLFFFTRREFREYLVQGKQTRFMRQESVLIIRWLFVCTKDADAKSRLIKVIVDSWCLSHTRKKSDSLFKKFYFSSKTKARKFI